MTEIMLKATDIRKVLGDEIEIDTARFYETLLSVHGTYVGPGHWFEVDDRHFRLGFGWPTRDDFDREIVRQLQVRNVGLVCLAGFMRLLTDGFVELPPGPTNLSKGFLTRLYRW